MTLSLFFEHASMSGLRLLVVGGYAAVLAAVYAGVLYGVFSGAFSSEPPVEGRRRRLFGAAAAAVFFFLSVWPLLPTRIFGLWYWPIRAGSTVLFLHSLQAALACAVAAWSFAPKGEGKSRFAAGLLAGACIGAAGVFSSQGLYLLDALRRIGHPHLGALLLWLVPPVAVSAYCLAASSLAFGHLRKTLGAALLIFGLFGVPTFLADKSLRAHWDFGALSLAESASVREAKEAPSVGILVLADDEGNPGFKYRERLLAAAGVEATPESLNALGRYLEARKFKTVFAEQALSALRQGWALNWDSDRLIDALLLTAGPAYPPDYAAFLDAVISAPVTPGNYEILDRVGPTAWEAKIPSIKTAQKTFEGFSTAYARFGEREKSDAWLRRIQGLWPLYEEDFHVEPIADSSDGEISGTIFFNGVPAQGLKVGLFVRPSTSSVVLAQAHLSAAEFPDGLGRFRFTDLLPGWYYLALQAEAGVLAGAVAGNAPGLIHVEYGATPIFLSPIEVRRRFPSEEIFPGTVVEDPET